MIKKLLFSTLTGIMITGISTNTFALSDSLINYGYNSISPRASQAR